LIAILAVRSYQEKISNFTITTAIEIAATRNIIFPFDLNSEFVAASPS